MNRHHYEVTKHTSELYVIFFIGFFPIFLLKVNIVPFFLKGGIKAGTSEAFLLFKCAAPECARYGCSSKNDCNS